MNRMVYNVFKAIMLSMIFVVIWTVGFYIWKVDVLNQRMESTLVSVQEVVSKNNYLPTDEADMFETILKEMGESMNGTGTDKFVNGINWNYGTQSTYTSSVIGSGTGNILARDMSAPANYGDVMVVEVEVNVNTPSFGYVNSAAAADSIETRYGTTTLTYVYLVPCLKYVTVTG